MRSGLFELAALIGVILAAGARLSADTLATTRPVNVAMEIGVLSDLDDLEVTPAQLDELQKYSLRADPLVVTVSDVERIDQAGDESRPCYFTLLRLREALLKKDIAKVEESRKDLEAMEEKMQISFSPRIEPGQAAQRAAAELLPQFSGRQIAGYLASHSEDVTDPTELLLGAITQCRGMELNAFNPFARDVARQVSYMVNGMRGPAQLQTFNKAMRLLTRAHRIRPDQFDDQKSDIEDGARAIAKVDSSVAIQHWMECELAQLVANPQLQVALEDRLLFSGHVNSN
jgi:hypothetical protein